MTLEHERLPSLNPPTSGEFEKPVSGTQLKVEVQTGETKEEAARRVAKQMFAFLKAVKSGG